MFRLYVDTRMITSIDGNPATLNELGTNCDFLTKAYEDTCGILFKS